MTVVYVDSVFLLNFLMDDLLLSATARLAGITLHRWRYLLAALTGGGYAVCVFLPGCGFLSGWPVKLAMGILMALIAYGGERRFWRLALLLLLVSCGFAGCVLALGLLVGSEVPVVNGIFYTNIDVKVLLLASGAAYATLSVVFRACGRHGGVGGNLVPVTISCAGREATLTALCDTGNGLSDPVTGRPVLVADAQRLSTLWPPEWRARLSAAALAQPVEALRELEGTPEHTRFRLIPYSAVGNAGGLLLAFRSDWTTVEARRYARLLIALSPTELGEGFAALWGEEEERNNGQVHPVDPVGAAKVEVAARRPLHRRQRDPAAAAVPGAGGGAVGPSGGDGGSKNADRAQSAAGGLHRSPI